MLTTTIDSFYFTPEELEASPSRAHGINSEQESCLRVYGAQMVQEAGIHLKCPQVVMATGQILLQRFYCKRSLRDFSIKKLAAAAVFLACKLEECKRVRVREVVLVFDRLWKRRDNAPLTLLEPGTMEYQAVKDSIIRYEREMLRVFGFIVHCDHPHKLLISLVKVLDGDQDLIQEAWNIVNDSLRTPLCVLYKSEVVASGAIFYAARKLQICLPESVPWWAAFSVKTEQLVAVVRTLHELYQKPKASFINVAQEALQPARKAVTEAEASPEALSVPSQSGGQQAAAAGDGVDQQGGAREENGGDASPSGAARADKEEAVSAGGTNSRDMEVGAAAPSISGSREGADRDRDRDKRDRDRSRGGRSRSREQGGVSSRDREGSGRDRDRGGRDTKDRGKDRDRDRDRDRSRGVGRSRSRSKERGMGIREREKARERDRERRDAEKLRAREKEKERDRAPSRRDRDKDRDRERDREREREQEPRGSRTERERERERERDLRERSLKVAEALRAEREKAAGVRDEASRDGLPPDTYGSRLREPLERAPSSSGREAQREDSRGAPDREDSRQRSDSAQRGDSRSQHRNNSMGQGQQGLGSRRSSNSSGSSSSSNSSEDVNESSTGGASSGERLAAKERQRVKHRQQRQAESARQKTLSVEQQQQALSVRHKPGVGGEQQGQGQQQHQQQRQPSQQEQQTGGRPREVLCKADSGNKLLDAGRGLREDDPPEDDRMYASEEMEMDDDLGEGQNGVLH